MNGTRRRDPAGGPLTGTRPPAAPPGNFAGLFGVERARLSELLSGLEPGDWPRPSPCPGWTVLGLCCHLLGDDLGLLSRQRDGYHGTPGDHRRAQVVVTQEAACGPWRVGGTSACAVDRHSWQDLLMQNTDGSPRSSGSAGSLLSIGSSGSILSIGSAGSILSIGSAGSILSVGSVGSVASAFSIGSAASVGSILSGLSCWSVLAWRSAGSTGPGRRRQLSSASNGSRS